MDFAFIQTATPAAQPAAVIDAAAPPAASTDNMDAFDAALSTSLAIVEKASAQDPAAGQEVQLQAPWLVLPVFTVPVEEVVPVDGEAASSIGDGDDEGADGDSAFPAIESAATDVASAQGVDVTLSAIAPAAAVTPQPAVDTVQTSVVRPSATPAQQGRVYAQMAVFAQAAGVENAQAPQSAATTRPAQFAPPEATPPQLATVGAGSAAAAAASAPAAAAAAPAAAASAPAAEIIDEQTGAPLANALSALAATKSNASATATAVPIVAPASSPANVPANPAAAAANVSPAVTGNGQTVSSAPAVLPPGFESVDVTFQGTAAEAATPAAAAPPQVRVNPGVARVQIDPVLPQVNVTQAATQVASTPAEVTVAFESAAPAAAPASAPPKAETPDSAAASVRSAVAPQLQFNNDATMTGGDQSSQGQGRRSAEFMRFAAALAHVAPAASDDGARIAVPAVAPSVAAPATAAPSAAPAVASAVLVPTTETPDAENIGRLVQAMRINARPGAWEATVHLKPEHLGEVTIALRVERNSVSAVVNAEAAGVRQWLESQEQAVRNGMAEHGLQLERFVVQRDGQRREGQSAPEQESRRRQPRRQPEMTERFEIVV